MLTMVGVLIHDTIINVYENVSPERLDLLSKYLIENDEKLELERSKGNIKQ